jgi:deoxycytidylate deaminase
MANSSPNTISTPALSVGIKTKVDSTKEISNSRTPELVLALCGPIGSPLHESATQIQHILGEFNYSTTTIRLSDVIRNHCDAVDVSVSTESKYKEITSLITAGDHLRERFGNDILAKLAVAQIGAERKRRLGEIGDKVNETELDEKAKTANQRVCHIVDSIKNTAELDLLRMVYGDTLFSIGIFSPLSIRKGNLSGPEGLNDFEMNELIDTDSGEEFSHGQSVRNTFPRCDLFIRIDHSLKSPTNGDALSELQRKVRRFFSLLFRTEVVSPTADESAMYAATAAGRNSSCLSRQVGAAVTTSEGEVLAVGWNDVPQSGGGLYGKPALFFRKPAFELSVQDHRCFAETDKKCHNDAEKQTIARKVVDLLVKENLIAKSNADEAVKKVLGDSRIKDLIEFSRAVHAEMHAILGASRVAGDRILGGRVYVTTYPCHSCARHIVAAGIAQIIYIEPYSKSLAVRLHSDSLSEEPSGKRKVTLRQFDGVAPLRFIELFEAGERKKNGIYLNKPLSSAIPSTLVSIRAIPRLEEVVVAEIDSTPGLKFSKLLVVGESNG